MQRVIIHHVSEWSHEGGLDPVGHWLWFAKQNSNTIWAYCAAGVSLTLCVRGLWNLRKLYAVYDVISALKVMQCDASLNGYQPSLRPFPRFIYANRASLCRRQWEILLLFGGIKEILRFRAPGGLSSKGKMVQNNLTFYAKDFYTSGVPSQCP